jgi:hypothetical protein
MSVRHQYQEHGLRLEIAIHEAGHAVISRVVGLVSGYATIREGGARSYCEDDGGIASVLTALAGKAATLEFGLGSEGCEIDDRKALRLLLADNLRSRWRARYMWKDLLGDARLLIRAHRRCVEAVANTLLAKEALSAAEIDQLMMHAEAWRHVTR